MKVISIWNPWASLIVHGHKMIETRGWTAPKALIGQRIGIASTKMIRPDQRRALSDRIFQRFYADTNLVDLDVLPNGYLLGTVRLDASVRVTQEFMDELPASERAFGWFYPGRYAWLLSKPQPLALPLPVRGTQGLWTIDDAEVAEAGGSLQEWPQDHGGYLPEPEWHKVLPSASEG